MSALPAHIDLDAFAARVNARRSDPRRVALAGRNLIDGALRIRRGGDGLYGTPTRPITKPAEAVGAWLKAMEREAAAGPFHRQAEMREALMAAAEEVDAAAVAAPAAERLRGALFSDAIDVIGGDTGGWRPWLPWLLVAGLGGVLIGVFMSRKR